MCTVEKLMLPHQKLQYEEIAAQYAHLRGLPIESYAGQPQLLIGANNIHAFAPMETKVGNPMEPIAVRTNLGWTVYGPRFSSTAATGNYLGYHQQITNDSQHERPKNCHPMEDTVIAISQESDVRKPPERTKNATSGRCEIGMLGKIDTLQVPDNHPMSIQSNFDKQIGECKQKEQVHFKIAPEKQRQVEESTTKHVSAQKVRPRGGEFQPERIRWKQAAVQRPAMIRRKWKRQSDTFPEKIHQRSKWIDERNQLELGNTAVTDEFMFNRKELAAFKLRYRGDKMANSPALLVS